MTQWKGFRFVVADTEKLKNAVYRLRYQVYVEELGFEKPEFYSYECEKDKYDPYSIHFAAINEQEEVVGTVRLILNSQEGLPVKSVAISHFLKNEPQDFKVAEISRLAILKSCRTISGDYLCSDRSKVTGRFKIRRKFPLITIGLYRIMYQTSKEVGITRWYMISEAKLFRIIKIYGFVFHSVGDEIDYHGLRTPYLGIISEFEQNLSRENPDFFRFFTEE